MPLTSISPAFVAAFLPLLEQQQVTAQHLAEKSGVSQQTISAIRTQKKVGQVRTIDLLLGALSTQDQMRFVANLLSNPKATEGALLLVEENLHWLVRVLPAHALKILQEEMTRLEMAQSPAGQLRLDSPLVSDVALPPIDLQSLLKFERTAESAGLFLQAIGTKLQVGQLAFAQPRRWGVDSLALVDSSPVATEGLLGLRQDGRISLVNSTFGRLWQLPKSVLQRCKTDERLMHHLVDLVQDPDSFMAAVQSDVDDPQQQKHHLVALKIGRILERRSMPQHLYEQTVGRIAVYRDVTDVESLSKALRDSERQFRAAFTQNAVAMAMTSLDGQYLRVNQAFCDLVGYDQIDLLQMRLQDLSIEADLAKEQSLLEQMRLGDLNTYTIEKRYCHQDGRTTCVKSDCSLVRDEVGMPLYISHTIQDITAQRLTQQQREQAERKLQQSEARYRAIVQDQSELICRYLPDTTLIFVNDAYVAYQGISYESLLNRRWITLLEEEEQKAAREWLSTLSPERKTFTTIEQIQINRSVHWIEWKNRVVLLDAEGNVAEIQAVGRDITDLKTTTDRLAKNEAMLNSIIENIPGAVYRGEHSFSWRDSFMSSTIEQITGYPCEEFTPSGDREYGSIMHPEDKAWVYEAEHQATVEQKEPFEVEYRIIHRDGSIRWVQERGRGHYDEQGNLLGIDGIISDITERKQHQLDLDWLTRDIPGIIYRCQDDDSWTMTFMGEGVQLFTGYSAADFRSGSASFRACIHPDDVDLIVRAGRDNPPDYTFAIEYRIVHRDGSIRWAYEHGKALLDATGGIIGWSGVILPLPSSIKAAKPARSRKPK